MIAAQEIEHPFTLGDGVLDHVAEQHLPGCERGEIPRWNGAAKDHEDVAFMSGERANHVHVVVELLPGL